MPGASSGLMGVIEAAQRRRRGTLTRDAGFQPQDAAGNQDLGGLEPDITTPALPADGPSASELSARYATGNDEEQPFFVSHPYAAAFLAGLGGSLSGRPGGGEEAIRTLSQARQQYRHEGERRLQDAIDEGQQRERMRQEQARHDETVRFRQEDIDRQEKHRQEDQTRADAKHQETLNKPISVGSEQGIYDPKAQKWIVPPRFRPTKEPAGKANQERDDAEKATERINKLREKSIDWNMEMESIRTSAEKGRGKGKKPWDEPATDPKTGYALGLTKRQQYEALKKKNGAAVSEINRLSASARKLRGETAAPAATTPAPTTAPSGALASALEKEARGDPVTSLTPEERKALIAYKEQQSAVQPGAASGG